MNAYVKEKNYLYMQSFSLETIQLYLQFVLLVCLTFHFVFFLIFKVPGCYEDSLDRVLESGPYRPPRNGKQYCKVYCETKRQFKYFGLEVCINLIFFKLRQNRKYILLHISYYMYVIKNNWILCS